MQNTCRWRAARTILAAAAASMAKGFSISTGFPAAMPAKACASWAEGGVAM